MKKYKKWDHTKVVRVFLLLFLDIILVNLSSFLALFTRMELDITALQRAGFLLSVRRYALIDTVCTILIFWLFRLYNSLWAYAGTNELTRIAVASYFSLHKIPGDVLSLFAHPQELPGFRLPVSHGIRRGQPSGLPLFP